MPNAEVSARMHKHYLGTFTEHGATSRGVDWGSDGERHALRLAKMLQLLSHSGVGEGEERTLLDVGCGYGALYPYLRSRWPRMQYTGIDLCKPMIDAALEAHPSASWIVGDLLEHDWTTRYDFVVCNGVLTQKLTTDPTEMLAFAETFIKRMFELSNIGMAFNVMTSHVNYKVPNLYYRDPGQVMHWVLDNITNRVIIDHSYELYEFTTYALRPTDGGSEQCGRGQA